MMEKEILNMEEAAELFNVSIKTFIKLLKEEKVPARKIGREWRFSRKALVEWLASGDSQAYSASEVTDTREFFNQVAPDWERLSSSYYDESIKTRLLELEILDRGMTLMDLGSGDGYISRAVAGYVEKVFAVDISREMLKELKNKAAREGISNIETIESDGQDVPLEDGCIDLVCASMYLHHIGEPEIAIREMARVLKPRGIVYLADFYEHSDLELKEKMHDLWPGFKAADLKQWFKNSGFVDIRIEKVQGRGSRTGTGDKAGTGVFTLLAVKGK